MPELVKHAPVCMLTVTNSPDAAKTEIAKHFAELEGFKGSRLYNKGGPGEDVLKARLLAHWTWMRIDAPRQVNTAANLKAKTPPNSDVLRVHGKKSFVFWKDLLDILAK